MNVKGFLSMTLGQDIITTQEGTKIHVGTGTPGFIHKKYSRLQISLPTQHSARSSGPEALQYGAP